MHCRFSSNYFGNGQGFQVAYESTDVTPEKTYRIGECGGSFYTPNAILTSPLYPYRYPNNSDCIYTISQPTGTVVNITFSAFDVHQFTHLTYVSDYLEIRDGSSEDAPLIGTLYGNTIPAPIQSTQNKMWMK